MTRNRWLAPGLVLAALAALAASGWWTGTPSGAQATVPQASPVVTDLDFKKWLSEISDQPFTILEDRSFDRLPPLSRSPRYGRRLVARGAVAPAAQAELADRLIARTEAWLKQQGAEIKGQSNLSQRKTDAAAQPPRASVLEFPRLFYAVGKRHGMVDIGCVAETGQVVLLLSWIEGD